MKFFLISAIFNWFRRLALSANMRKQRIDTVRLKLQKIAAKVVRSARYITFKLCSSCPYKNEFYETISNIGNLNVQLEQQLLTNLDSLTIALDSTIGILRPFDREIERCYELHGAFLILWYSYRFRYCSMNNSGYIMIPQQNVTKMLNCIAKNRKMVYNRLQDQENNQ